MTPDPAGIRGSRTPGRAAPRWGGGDAPHGTVGWYRDASGGFIPAAPDTWNAQVAFPAIRQVCIGARWPGLSSMSWPRRRSTKRPVRSAVGRAKALGDA